MPLDVSDMINHLTHVLDTLFNYQNAIYFAQYTCPIWVFTVLPLHRTGALASKQAQPWNLGDL
jgi:hypothetical protein